MAQMTGAISPKALKLEISTNGSATTPTWTDISGYSAEVAPSGGDRRAGEVFTYDGDQPIMTTGKREIEEWTIRAVYEKSSTATVPYQYFRAALTGNTTVWVRYSPEGGTTGDKQYTMTGKCLSCPPVAGPADSGNPILFEAKVRGKVTEATVT